MPGNPDYQPHHDWEKALEAALETRDAYTLHHSTRVCTISQDIGRSCGLNSNDLAALYLASALHDIGKLGIPDTVLLKPGQLNEAEWQIMKTHSALGEKILRTLNLNNSENVASIIRHHHEHYNGNGYPDGLSRDQIPIQSRIIAVADSYDAMTTRRTYANARTHRETLEIILSEQGTKLDPRIVGEFCQIMEDSTYRAD